MNRLPRRPLALDQLRAFDAVARHLSFSAAADEMSLTQSAVSRQIKALEDDLGARLFQRGTRQVSLTSDGLVLHQAVASGLQRIDAAVRQIRQRQGRSVISVSTFASMASLWLLPRVQEFQSRHPDVDIRISATDQMLDLEHADVDLVLRFCRPDDAPADAQRLFGEVLSPVVSASFLAEIGRGERPPLRQPADLREHPLLEDADLSPSAQLQSWHIWLQARGLAGLQPRRWLYLNYTDQRMQSALAGQGVALGRLALIADVVARGELVEVFGESARSTTAQAYWLALSPNARGRAELQAFCSWIVQQAANTRALLGPALE